MKKTMLIETLEAMSEATRACAEIWEKDGDKVWSAKATSEWITIDTVIRMLQDDRFAKKIRAVYFTEDGVRK